MHENTIQVVGDMRMRFLDVPVEIPVQRLREDENLPALFDQVLRKANWLWCNENTIKFSILSSDSSLLPQWLAALLAWDVEVVLDGGDSVPLASLEASMRSRLNTLRIPLDGADRVWGEAHVARTPSDTPIVSAVAVLDIADGQVQTARLALTGAWEERARLAESIDSLVGNSLDEGQIEEVVAAVTEEVEPPEDFLGTAEYRQAMAGVLTRRALTQCMQTGA